VIDINRLEISAAKAGRSDNDGLPSRARYRIRKPGEDLPPISDESVKAARKAQSVHLVERAAPSSDIHVRAYNPPNWFTTSGVLKNRKRIEARGLPSFTDWRFITLTLDREQFSDPLEGYLKAKDFLRKFMHAARAAKLWNSDTKWCWKLEFQKDGWPHWHLLVGRKRMFSEAQLEKIRHLWSIGRTNVERVEGDEFLYSFKYAFKPVIVREDDEWMFEDDNEVTAPSWFLDYIGVESVRVEVKDPVTGDVVDSFICEKPKTFARARFWQTSEGFYTGKTRPREVKDKEQQSWSVPLPVRIHEEKSRTKVQIVSRKRSGRYLKSATLALTVCASALWNIASWYAIEQKSVFLGINSAVIPHHIISRHTKETHKLEPLLWQNKLTVQRAVRLQQRGETLRNC